MSNGIRQALESAMQASAEPTEETAPVEVVEAPSEPETPEAPVEAAPEAPEVPEKPKVERVRAPDGKFARKPKDVAEPKPVAAKPDPAGSAAGAPTGSVPPVAGAAQPSVVEPPKPDVRAPQSWKPQAREHFAKLPAEVQAEVVRRERETAVALQEAAEARKFHGSFRETVAPFEGMLRAEGVDPIKAVGSLLQTAAALRTAPPAHKAQLVASMIKQFAIPIDVLDSVLAGETPKQPAQQGGPAVDPAAIAQQVQRQILSQFEAQRAQRETQKADADLQAFLTESPEFLEDVREDMADLIEAKARRGIVLTPKAAYDAALKMHLADEQSEVGSVLRQREKAKQANAARASTQQARAAASSVKSQPVGVVAPSQPSDRRAALKAAMAKGSGQ